MWGGKRVGGYVGWVVVYGQAGGWVGAVQGGVACGAPYFHFFVYCEYVRVRVNRLLGSRASCGVSYLILNTILPDVRATGVFFFYLVLISCTRFISCAY